MQDYVLIYLGYIYLLQDKEGKIALTLRNIRKRLIPAVP